MEGCHHVRKIGSRGIKTELLDRPLNLKYLIKYTLLLHLCGTSVSRKTTHLHAWPEIPDKMAEFEPAQRYAAFSIIIEKQTWRKSNVISINTILFHVIQAMFS